MPSLAAAPLCRFGDTLSNELAMVWFRGQQQRGRSRPGEAGDGGGGGGGRGSGDGRVGGSQLPVWVATFLGSLGAAAFHAVVVPLDTYKVRERRRRRTYRAVFVFAVNSYDQKCKIICGEFAHLN